MVSTVLQPRDIRVGGGALRHLGEVIASLGATRPLVVSDQYLVSTGLVDQVMRVLEQAGTHPVAFTDTVPDPTTDSLARGLSVLTESSSDAVIAIGGGSPIDTGKALAILGVHGGAMSDYRAPRRNVNPGLPMVAVPTTAGSGSEVTQFAVITDSATSEKMLCAGPAFLPQAAIIDYELTMSMPPRLTADTGIDALTHSVEAYISRKANAFTDSLCLTSMAKIWRYIRRAYADGLDSEAREAMMLASTQAGIAFSNSSVALIHGMSRPLGAHFGIAHGMSNAMLFPAVAQFSLPSSVGRFAECARAVGVAGDHESDETAASLFVDSLAQLSADLDVPTPASRGISWNDWCDRVPVMVSQALASGSPQNNPRVPTAEEIGELYRKAYGPKH